MERIDDLEFENLKIIQNPSLYSFSLDPIMLVNLSKVPKNAVVCDLCSGSGIVPILVAGKSKAKKIYAMEIQKELSNLAKKSITLNNLQDKIEFINDEIANYPNYINNNSIDVVYCNPPYAKKGSAILGDNESRNLARIEITTTLSQVVEVASKMLKSGGVFYMIHKANRLQEIMTELNTRNLFAKEIIFFQSNKDAKFHLLFVKAVKDGNLTCEVLPPIIINNADGSMTDQVQSLYSKKSI